MSKYDEMCIFEQYEVDDFKKTYALKCSLRSECKNGIMRREFHTLSSGLVADFDTLCYFQPILRVVILGEFYYIRSDWSRAVK